MAARVKQIFEHQVSKQELADGNGFAIDLISSSGKMPQQFDTSLYVAQCR